MPEKDKQIGFRGSEEYRSAVQSAALARRMKVQEFLSRIVQPYLDDPNLRPGEIRSGERSAKAHGIEQQSKTQDAPVSADESVWIQKLTDLLRSTEYGEAAKHEIGALHGAMTIDKALARVEDFAREAEADNEAGIGERGAKALEIIRAVKDSIKAARHAVRARSDNTRGRRGNHGHSS